MWRDEEKELDINLGVRRERRREDNQCAMVMMATLCTAILFFCLHVTVLCITTNIQCQRERNYALYLYIYLVLYIYMYVMWYVCVK